MKKMQSGTVAKYIAACPKDAQGKLRDLRAAVRAAAPGATERTDYFAMPGYSYAGSYDYDGMFAWFSFKKPFVRLHVRPLAIAKYKKDLKGYALTKAIVSFPADKKVPAGLVKKLVKASVRAMKQAAA